MTTTTSSGRTQVPARHLQVLSTFWLPAAVLCGLVALGAASTAGLGVAALLGARAGQTPTAGVIGVVVAGLAAVVLGLITWRLAVVVPRDLRAWRLALEERRTALGD